MKSSVVDGMFNEEINEEALGSVNLDALNTLEHPNIDVDEL